MLAEWEELERQDKIDPASMQALRDSEAIHIKYQQKYGAPAKAREFNISDLSLLEDLPKPERKQTVEIPESIYIEPIEKENINPIEAEARYQAQRKPGLSVAIRCLDEEQHTLSKSIEQGVQYCSACRALLYKREMWSCGYERCSHFRLCKNCYKCP